MKDKIKCPHCKALTRVSPSALRLHPLGYAYCEYCGGEFDPGQKSKDNLLRSKDQESKAAKKYGGRRQVGSGASKRAKGDFVDRGRVRGECKFTRAKSYILKLEELLKIEKEALRGEMPIFEVQYQGVHPPKSYVVIPAEWYQYLVNKAEGTP